MPQKKDFNIFSRTGKALDNLRKTANPSHRSKPKPQTKGKKQVTLTAKQMAVNIQARRSERAGHKMIRDNPPKVSVRAWLGSKIGVRKEKTRQGKVRKALRSAQGRRSGR